MPKCSKSGDLPDYLFERYMKIGQNDVKILLVEDERNLARTLKKQMEHVGYMVDHCCDGIEAQARVSQKEYNLIVLDVMLPGKSGFDVLQEWRSQQFTTPVLILTGLDSPKNRIKGLSLGADDYLLKPFDSGELIARIEAILRRAGFDRTSIHQASDLVLNTSDHTVQRGGKQINLTDKEYALLEFFLRNKNQIITRKRLIEQVWGYTFETGTNIVDVYVSYLRDAIDKGFSKKLLKTIHGEGFILVDD